MRITMDLHRTPTGHLAGWIAEEGRPGVLSFHGVLELLDVLERVVDGPAAEPDQSTAPGGDPDP